MGFCIGLDRGGAGHSLCVVDAQGAIAGRFEVAHTAGGLTELKARLARFGNPAELPVALERPSGLVVEALFATDRPVVPIHPNIVKASRQIAKLTSRIRHAVAALPDGQIIMSFPRAGRICAAHILAELGDVRDRYLTADQLAADAGLCPVTHQSAKSRGVTFRWACNRRLRQAITGLADNSRHSSSWAADIYRRAKAHGCRHPHAIRILGRAWVRVLWRAWVDRRIYDPARHRAANAIPG
jgi:transposase